MSSWNSLLRILNNFSASKRKNHKSRPKKYKGKSQSKIRDNPKPQITLKGAARNAKNNKKINPFNNI